MNRILNLLLLLFISLPVWAQSADKVWVIDKLLVGVHEQKSLDSAIIKVLPTGTPLEVLEREGELARVRDPENVTGWVDAAYLMTEQPAATRLEVIAQQKTALEERITKLQTAAGGGNGDGALSAELETVTRENTELKGKLSEQRLRAGQLQSEVAELRAELEASTAPPDARIVELERTREALEKDLADAKAANAELEARASLQATSAMVPLVLKEYALATVFLVLLLAGGGFVGGMYVVDLLSRRRHGGFRI